MPIVAIRLAADTENFLYRKQNPLKDAPARAFFGGLLFNVSYE